MPSPRLRTRIFIALTLLLLGLLLGFGVFSYWSLLRGLGPYVAQIELGRLEYLESQLRQDYLTRQSWESITPERWQRLISEGKSSTSSWVSEAPSEPAKIAAGPGGGQLHPIDRYPIQERLGLLDKNGKLVAGAPMAPGSALNPLLDAKRQLIGTLLLRPPPVMKNQIDSAFLREYLVFLCAAGALGLLAAMVLSWRLSRRWMRPIEALSQGAQSFADGQLGYRIPVRGNDELAQLAMRYNHMAEQLQYAQEQQMDWLSQVAHELRTPLAAIRAEIEALQDGIRRFDDKTADRLHGQTMRLTRLVEDLRASLNTNDTAAAQPRAVQPQPQAQDLDIQALVMDSVDGMRARYERSQIGLPPASALEQRIMPATVQGHAEQLHQVFANVLENSLRYTDAGGQVDIHARLVTEPAAAAPRCWWEVMVDDTPPAVADPHLPRLFERFFRADASRSRASGGSGLGLAICRSIVQAHGGDILAAHSPLGGLRICIRLPLAATQAAAP